MLPPKRMRKKSRLPWVAEILNLGLLGGPCAGPMLFEMFPGLRRSGDRGFTLLLESVLEPGMRTVVDAQRCPFWKLGWGLLRYKVGSWRKNQSCSGKRRGSPSLGHSQGEALRKYYLNQQQEAQFAELGREHQKQHVQRSWGKEELGGVFFCHSVLFCQSALSSSLAWLASFIFRPVSRMVASGSVTSQLN